MDYLNNLSQNLALFSNKTMPATIDEILELESKIGQKIPESLKEFFLLVGGDYDVIWGGGGGDKLQEIDYTINLSKSLLNETSVDLGDYFPFSSYNDDQFLFVNLFDGEDPPVYRFELELYYCGEDYLPNSSAWGLPKGVSKIAESFSGMINDIVNLKLNKNSC